MIKLEEFIFRLHNLVLKYNATNHLFYKNEEVLLQFNCLEVNEDKVNHMVKKELKVKLLKL